MDIVKTATDTARRTRRTTDAASALRADVARWLRERRGQVRFRRFLAHFDAVETVLHRMLDRLDEELSALPEEPGLCYQRCRWLDTRLDLVRGLFNWYATRYDQRLPGSPHAELLRAADEVVRACWQEAFVAAGVKPPTGPLCFAEVGTSGHSLRRCSVPAAFRVPETDVLAEFVELLPVPLVALPEAAVREPWWLVVSAHETGHHVQHDLNLTAATVDAVGGAVPTSLRSEWKNWSGEVFADVFSVLMLGDAAGWAVGELQFGPPAHLNRPTGLYPAPAVRSALFSAVLRELEAPGAESHGAVGHDDEQMQQHLDVVPTVVASVLALPVGGKPLRSLADLGVVRDTALVARWAGQLTRPKPVFGPLGTRSAPRVLLAAAVRQYRAGGNVELAHHNLVTSLARSGTPGVLADVPKRSLDEVADDLARRLFSAGEVE